MKILFLTNKVPYPPKDGGSIASFGMMKAMADAGHKVTVLAMNTLKHHVTPFEIPEEIKALITFHLVEVPAAIKPGALLRNLLFSNVPYNAERFIDPKYSTKLQSLLSAFSYDVIQLEGLYLYPYIPVIRQNSRALIAYRSHNIEHEIWERSILQAEGFRQRYLKILARRLKKFETKAVNQYDLLVPITNRDLEKLNQMGNTKPALAIPAGFDTEEVRMVYPNFQMNLFFIGALDWSPNQEGLIWFIDRCWPEIQKLKPGTILKIAGRNAPDWLVEKFQLENIEYMGEIDDAQKFIASNGIMIAPVLSGSGMRVKIIEGMLNQKSIVTTSIGCEGIHVENEVHLYIANQAKDYVSYIVELLNNKNRVVETGIRAYNYVREEYDNRLLIRKLVEFYKHHLA
ncbi:MAG: glycosyltransferase [Prolixibacteraceae bacterium]|nr:glycosyltransferase [Prolixibacteraceae bacterium]